MTEYFSADDSCRSRMLLSYFGEKSDHDCGMCDVCLARRNTLTSESAIDETQAEIMSMLADKHRHHITELHSIRRPYEQIDAAITALLHEEIVYQQDGMIFIE